MARVTDFVRRLAFLTLILSGSAYGCSIEKTLSFIQNSAKFLDVAMTKEARAQLREGICDAVADSRLASLNDDQRDALAEKVIAAYVIRLAEVRAKDPSLKILLRTQAEKDGLIERRNSAGWAEPVPRPYGWVNIDPADSSARTFLVNGENVGASRRVLALAGNTLIVGLSDGAKVCEGAGAAVAAATTSIACSGVTSP